MKGLLEALAEWSTEQGTPSADLRARLLGSVATPRLRFAPFFGALGDLFDLGEQSLGALFERAAAPGAFTPSPIAGVDLFHLEGGPRVAAADNGLVRVRAGAQFPAHAHLGPERVLILEGAYRDEPSGRVYQAGDWHEMASGSRHSYTVLPERALLVAVSVLDGVEVDGLGRLP